MRIFGALLAVGGCFRPAPPAGAPCDPLGADHCPSGQHCRSIAGAFVCTTEAGDPADAALIDTSELMADAALDAMPDAMPVQAVYMATVAECIDPATPNPAACRSANGNAQLVIDLMDSGTNEPWYSFVRFDIDNILAGKTITAVKLRLVVTTSSNAPGPDSGSVFRVSAFTLASLSTTTPAKQDATALAGNQGAVAIGDTVEWSLPTTLVTPGAPVYLGLYPNDDNGVNYWNLDGTTPPRLIVDAQ